MSLEIERKFLVSGDAWQSRAEGQPCVQGYIPASSACGVRVRILGNQGYLTLKGPSHGCERAEYEYPIPAGDAREILETFCVKPLIEKTRHTAVHNRHTWEIDVFHGANEGLVLAEIELDAADESFDLPPWVSEEVTGRPEYYNFSLVRHPYSAWNN